MRISIVGMNVVNVIRSRSMESSSVSGSNLGWMTIVWPRYSQVSARTTPPVVKNGVVARPMSSCRDSVEIVVSRVIAIMPRWSFMTPLG